MTFRQATINDIPELQRIFAAAREYMILKGNPTQWSPDYPSNELLEREIAAEHCYAITDDKGELHATFCFILGDDPTYTEIEGCWLNDEPYGTIHRIASDGTFRSVLHMVVEWSSALTSNIRIDTHRDNTPMLTALALEDFQYCGTIRCWNGTEREAFQKQIR